ncbi:MAG: dihydropteroate synthase [Nitrospira bacterium SG8_3]|nr:MAG: dihydropteroate synthase [Nitrospira bacterium SG8_3]
MKGQAFLLSWRNYTLELGRRTHIMGVLNVTPDSFSDGGIYFQRDKAIAHGLSMARDGADIIDVGGESTRPYSEKISAGEELDRVIPVIQALSKDLRIPISIDTCKADVARQALKAGASMINDISALRFDPEMIPVAAKAAVPVILMHMQGIPTDMQTNPTYKNLIPEIVDFLKRAMDKGVAGGIRKQMIIVDPGIGFGKTFDHNLQIIRELGAFNALERPILLGASNKAFIGHILQKEPHERDTGSMAAVAAGVLNGAHIVRVHNVKKTIETVKMIDAIKRGSVEEVN